jgi:hypothetical protein
MGLAETSRECVMETFTSVAKSQPWITAFACGASRLGGGYGIGAAVLVDTFSGLPTAYSIAACSDLQVEVEGFCPLDE